jgi:hypothetical protein
MKICKVEGCNAKHNARGFCVNHYTRFLRTGETRFLPKPTICKVDGCERKIVARGYCSRHYYQIRHLGKILPYGHRDTNKIIQYGDICLVYLYAKQGQHKATAIIETADRHKVEQLKWCLLSREGYVYQSKKRLNLGSFLLGIKDKRVADHINHRPLDYRRSNLRVCTPSQNLRNTSIKKRGVSGFKGVVKTKKTWHARIRVNNKEMYLGTFKKPEDAAREYDKFALKYYGEFACVNFPIGADKPHYVTKQLVNVIP